MPQPDRPDLPDPLVPLGWDDDWTSALAESAPPVPPAPVGRVARTERGRVLVLTGTGPRTARVPPSTGVTTGDWVVLDDEPAVSTVLPRRTELRRGSGRRAALPQVLAANADVVAVLVPLSAPPNARRLERLLAVAWDSGAEPLVLATKADLATAATADGGEVAAAAPGVDVLVTSTLDGRGLAELAERLRPHRTLALLGASGAGKSSLVNALVGAEVVATSPVRGDGKGRHTSTARELVAVPGGGLLLDTPGLRGIQLWDADDGVEQVFADVHALAEDCRFDDCRHDTEPGCAVQAAVGDGRLDAGRVESARALERELAWLARRSDAGLQAEHRRRWRVVHKAQRARGHR